MTDKSKNESKHFRPLSQSMIQKLKHCREKQLNENGGICTMNDMNYAVAPLYKRGFIETRKRIIENKLLLCIYVTEEGIKFLENVEMQ